MLGDRAKVTKEIQEHVLALNSAVPTCMLGILPTDLKPQEPDASLLLER
jgi:hypothetical protein